MEHVPAPEQPTVLGELHRARCRRASAGARHLARDLSELLGRIRAARSTIVFVNSRAAVRAPRASASMRSRASVSCARITAACRTSSARRSRRRSRPARLRGLVATSSLELGIDMGAVDLVLLVESPGSVARGLQRVGRAGHAVGETSLAPASIRSSAAICSRARSSPDACSTAQIEETSVPRNALDVLAQQIVAMVSDRAAHGGGAEARRPAHVQLFRAVRRRADRRAGNAVRSLSLDGARRPASAPELGSRRATPERAARHRASSRG